jgi:hypothetical protein
MLWPGVSPCGLGKRRAEKSYTEGAEGDTEGAEGTQGKVVENDQKPNAKYQGMTKGVVNGWAVGGVGRKPCRDFMRLSR